jgi:hypothetical protein
MRFSIKETYAWPLTILARAWHSYGSRDIFESSVQPIIRSGNALTAYVVLVVESPSRIVFWGISQLYSVRYRAMCVFLLKQDRGAPDCVLSVHPVPMHLYRLELYICLQLRTLNG